MQQLEELTDKYEKEINIEKLKNKQANRNYLINNRFVIECLIILKMFALKKAAKQIESWTTPVPMTQQLILFLMYVYLFLFCIILIFTL